MRKINTSSLVKSLLVSSTALCGIGFIAPHALADDVKAYTETIFTTEPEPEKKALKVPTGLDASGNMQYEWRVYDLNLAGIGRDDSHVTYDTTDPGTSTGNVTVTLPVGKDQILYYTYNDQGYAAGTRINDSLSTATVTNKLFKDISWEKTSESAWGGAIYNNKDASGVNITSDFFNNHAKSGGYLALGGAINNYNAKIGDIKGDFVGNWVSGGHAEGGAINNLYGLINTITGDFVGNWAKTTSMNDAAQGGAIYNQGGAGDDVGKIGDITGDFIGNWASSEATGYTYAQGGAIYNYTSGGGGGIPNTVIIGNIKGDFIGNWAITTTTSNNASVQGGAIYNMSDDGGNYGNKATITSITGDFIGNWARSEDTGSISAQGGAIYNYSYNGKAEATISNIAGDFIGNRVTSANGNSSGGAIFNCGDGTNTTAKITFAADTESKFIGNYAQAKNQAIGGVIYNNKTIEGLNGTFAGNYATSAAGNGYGGAIYNDTNGTITFATGTTSSFQGNYASTTSTGDAKHAFGGAIYNVGTVSGLNGDFAGNYVKTTAYNGNGRGGAIYNKGTIDSIVGNFMGNHVTVNSADGYGFGGAIANENQVINSLNGTFTGNYVEGKYVKGGAIHVSKGTVTFTASDDINKFTGNYVKGSEAYGGAIYNFGTVNINVGSTVEFSGNYTTLDGNSKTWNDIYNKGADGTNKAIINLYGTMNLDGGITGNSGYRDYSELNVFGGATLGFTVRNFTNGAFTTSADGTIIANQKVTFKENTTTNDTVVTFVPVVLADNYVKDVTDKYALFDDWTTTGGTPTVVIDGVTFKVAENELYDITFDETTGVFSFVSKYVPPGPGPEPEPESKIKQNILANGGSNNDAILAELLIDPNLREYSANENFNTVMDTVSTNYQLGNFNEVVKATKAMNPDEAPVVSNASIDAVQSAFGIAGARLTGVFTPAKEVQKTTGKASGSDAKKEGVWAKGFYGQSKLKGDAGFKNKSWGIGVGFDHQFTPNFMLGVGYAYGQSDIDTDSRDIKAKTHTPVIYGEYKQKKWFIDGMLSYSFGKYDEKKSVTGVNDDVDYDVNTFGAQAIGGYAVTPWFIPEVGFRYFNVSQKDYTDNLGNNFDKKNANVFTGVIGAKFAKAFEASKGVNLVPELRLAASYDFVRDNNEVDVTLANMHSYTFKGEKLDRFGFEVDAGFKVDAGEFELAARYEGRFRNDFYNHTGLLEARYEF